MKTKHSPGSASTSDFISQLGDRVSGVLEGFDRLRLRGALRQLYCPRVMEAYMCAQHLMYRDFKAMAKRTTAAVKTAAAAFAARWRRPMIYVGSCGQSKEGLAREIARRDGIGSCLIAVFEVVSQLLILLKTPDLKHAAFSINTLPVFLPSSFNPFAPFAIHAACGASILSLGSSFSVWLDPAESIRICVHPSR